MKKVPKKPSKRENQTDRFKAKAKELGADESGEAMEHAFKKIIPIKKP